MLLIEANVAAPSILYDARRIFVSDRDLGDGS
jgi:hypothetical protein